MVQKIRDPKEIKIKRALISVYDKDRIVDFAKGLLEYGIEIISTGGTAKTLKDAGIPVTDISDVTNFPEIMDGRVKTLHPNIHGALLARQDNEEHLLALHQNNIQTIDMVVSNLYPFVKTVRDNSNFDDCIENIDIGGPAMIRASAKNHHFVTIVTDIQDYERVLEELKNHDGATRYSFRRRLASHAFTLTATYDSNIAQWFYEEVDKDKTNSERDFPRRISFSGTLKNTLRYGENPHQKAALYTYDSSQRLGVTNAAQVQGKELSYNNINDTDAAFELVSEFQDPAIAIIKHANPCGVAVGENLLDAYENAFNCDQVSAFGGIIAMNRMLDAKTAAKIIEIFSEVIIAPSVEAAALDVLKKKDKIRVLTTGGMPDPRNDIMHVRRVAGGLLVQTMDLSGPDDFTMAEDLTDPESGHGLRVVSEREPTQEELRDMIFAFTVAKHVKSNAIVYAKNQATVGIGAGQMSRLDSSRIAAIKAQDAAKTLGLEHPLTKGSVVASDAFFPFADGLIAAAEAGVTAVIQPGGSIRDDEVIEAANERGLAMVFTGRRHFRH